MNRVEMEAAYEAFKKKMEVDLEMRDTEMDKLRDRLREADSLITRLNEEREELAVTLEARERQIEMLHTVSHPQT